MPTKSNLIAAAIYLSFALDSVLKFGGAFQVHIGILGILCISLAYFLSNPKRTVAPLKKDATFTIFVTYCILNGLILQSPGFFEILPYLLIAMTVCIYCHLTYKKTNFNLFYCFQLVLIATGIVQYYLVLAHGYQISFIDAEHYQKISSVSSRLRGFFIEPNWFAIALTFNTLLLVKDDPISFFRRNYIISLLTIIVMILNGSIAPVALLFMAYSSPYIKRAPIKGAILGLLFFSLLVAVFTFRAQLSEQNQSATTLNYLSRWVPLTRVIEFQSEGSLINTILGNGLGSWGTLAVKNRLSALVHEEDPASRDGSEVPVFIFELGIFGLIILIIDTAVMYRTALRTQYYLKAGILIFLAFLFLYPTLKFWMYMPYYFYLRAAIHATTTETKKNIGLGIRMHPKRIQMQL